MSCLPCPPSCESVFDRVVVSYLIRGNALVLWELRPEFIDPPPLTFTLQVGHSANPGADDWEDVGLSIVNQYFAIDPEQRVWGKTQFTHYRIKLETSQGTYYSAPTGGLGTLSRRDWRIAREIVRGWKLAARLDFGSQEGYLLKRRWTGAKCPTCLDHMTDEIRDPECTTCYGTGFLCGYYYPMSCIWAKMDPRTYRTELDGGQARGTINDVRVKTEMLNTVLLGEDDVWVAAATDDRYYVHRVTNISEIRGLPIKAEVDLRPIPFSSVIYTIEIPQQLERLAGLEAAAGA